VYCKCVTTLDGVFAARFFCYFLCLTTSSVSDNVDALRPTTSSASDNVDVLCPTTSSVSDNVDALCPTTFSASDKVDATHPTSPRKNIAQMHRFK